MQITETNGLFVIHFLNIAETDWKADGADAVSCAYRRAVSFAGGFGGKRFHNYNYGGGVAFDCEQQLHDCVEAYKLSQQQQDSEFVFTCDFKGRKNGAIGATYHIVDSITLPKDTPLDQVRVKLQDKYEHVSELTINGDKA
jgi:hypothetical protein